jgi:hypothetical protein
VQIGSAFIAFRSVSVRKNFANRVELREMATPPVNVYDVAKLWFVDDANVSETACMAGTLTGSEKVRSTSPRSRFISNLWIVGASTSLVYAPTGSAEPGRIPEMRFRDMSNATVDAIWPP